MHFGDDVTNASNDVVTRQRSSPSNESLSWLQPVMKFVDNLLHNNRRDTACLQRTLTLISNFLTLHIGVGMCSEYVFSLDL